jgi:hypothetical protein
MEFDKSDRKLFQSAAREAYKSALVAVERGDAQYANVGLGGLSALSMILMNGEATKISERMELSDLRIEVDGLGASLHEDIAKAGLD